MNVNNEYSLYDQVLQAGRALSKLKALASDPSLSRFDHSIINRDIVLLFYLLKITNESPAKPISQALIMIEAHVTIFARVASLPSYRLHMPAAAEEEKSDPLVVINCLMKVSHGFPEFIGRILTGDKRPQ